ncbi:MAG TPA: ABC transporter substrate-binding protein [Ferrovibrio sp.]|jgi:phospholipid transport system substrate-binding protein|uniref:MlaC/ttg2D family ABC transporter substrate-binding protein n=1 Tax=Ferrovibrio sp. TaxID=1917215 RepID=UPI002B4B095D|nr:ABC transporter substrate-binding protein [Ferrovibrio sp.]HLT75956.1 ABC transporter substrate-binding protein [Ferrovibrio sp.]
MLQMPFSRRPVLMLLVAAGIGLFASLLPARAAEADSFIRQVGNETLKALEDRSITQEKREDLLRNLLTTHLDLEAVGRFCLGRYSRSLTDAQRPEYQRLFEDYLVKVYSQLLAQYNGETFEVREGARSAGSETIVESQILRQNGPPIRVEWKTHEKNGKPLVTDVVVEGVSMAFTQRQQFESVIQNNGGKIDALFAAMRKQIARR